MKKYLETSIQKEEIAGCTFKVRFTDLEQTFVFNNEANEIDDTYQIAVYTIKENGCEPDICDDVSLSLQDIYLINVMLNNGTYEINIECEYSQFEYRFNTGKLV